MRTLPPSLDGLPIGRRIAARRVAVGLSGQELAARAGISSSQLSRIERGKHDPSWRTTVRLFGVLGIALREEEIGGTTDNRAA